MFCNNCGKQLISSAKFCDNCGTYVQDNYDKTGKPLSALDFGDSQNHMSNNTQSPPTEQNWQGPPLSPPQGQSWQAPPSPPQGQSWQASQSPPQGQGWQAPQSPPQGQGWQNQPQRVNDDPSGWKLIGFLLSFFVSPIIGLILYLVWKDDYPKKASAVGKGTINALITMGIIVGIFIIIAISTAGCAAYYYAITFI